MPARVKVNGHATSAGSVMFTQTLALVGQDYGAAERRGRRFREQELLRVCAFHWREDCRAAQNFGRRDAQTLSGTHAQSVWCVQELEVLKCTRRE